MADVHDDDHSRDGGLVLDRRRLLLLAGAGALTLAGCRHDEVVTPTATAPAAASAPPVSGCAPIPAETAGPFPGDGSNGPNLLAQAGAVRGDIRASLAPATGVAEGVPLEFRLALCPPRAGVAIYVWHCDRDGRYSMYSDGVTDETFLRGVQETGADGVATFRSIFPGCYPGRWPHIHFEVYASLADASAGAAPITTSQLAFPADASAAAYATAGYEASAAALAALSLASDGVFADDGGVRQLATMSGDVAAGYVAKLPVGV